jgi:hypothetical protein
MEFGQWFEDIAQVLGDGVWFCQFVVWDFSCYVSSGVFAGATHEKAKRACSN